MRKPRDNVRLQHKICCQNFSFKFKTPKGCRDGFSSPHLLTPYLLGSP